jgi:hypothetical protein
LAAREVSDASPCDFEGDTAREKKHRIHENDGRQSQRVPVIRRGLTDDQSTGERGERHADGREADPDASARGLGRKIVKQA